MKWVWMTLLVLMSTLLAGFVRGEESVVSSTISLEEALSILESRTQSMGTREVAFIEKRIFPFRSKAATVEGTVRLSDSLGVSIEYPDKNAVLVIDDEGLIMRRLKDNGKIREREVALEDAEFAGLMASVMAFDRERLSDAFSLSVEGTQDDWTLRLLPKELESGKVVEALIRSDNEKVHEVLIELVGSRKIVIEILEETPIDGFNAEEIRSYFRGEKE